MGAIHFSIDSELARALRDGLALTTFVETGTFEGESIRRVKNLFQHVYSVECSRPLFEKAKEAFADFPNVEVALGDSPGFVKSLTAELSEEPTLFWLDAHWCAAEGADGEGSQCPLLAELAAIGRLNARSVVMIDDARLFLSPPAAPHDASHWPKFSQIIRELQALSSEHEMTVFNDVILFHPTSVSAVVEDYSRHHGFDLLGATNLLAMSKAQDLYRGLVEKEAVIQSLIAEVDQLRRKLQKASSPAAKPGQPTVENSSRLSFAPGARMQPSSQPIR